MNDCMMGVGGFLIARKKRGGHDYLLKLHKLVMNISMAGNAVKRFENVDGVDIKDLYDDISARSDLPN